MRALGLALALVPLAAATSRGAAPEEGAPASLLRVKGMTFVGSKGSERELLLRSASAVFDTQTRVAHLEDVSAEVNEGEEGRSFTVTCERAELDVDSNDFLAEGTVRGETGDGQRYEAPWVRYEHETGVLYTEAPVRVEDATGSFRGDGFRYLVRERRFRLLGNVRVEQEP